MEQLELLGGLEVTSSSGASAKVERAVIDMKAQQILSKDPVEVETAEAKLTADRLEISAAEKRISTAGGTAEVSFDYDLGQPIEKIRATYSFDVSCQGAAPPPICCFLQ